MQTVTVIARDVERVGIQRETTREAASCVGMECWMLVRCVTLASRPTFVAQIVLGAKQDTLLTRWEDVCCVETASLMMERFVTLV